VVVIGLVADNLAWVRTSGAKNSVTNIVYNVTMNHTELVQSSKIAVLPLNLHLASYWLMLAAGICGTLDAVLIGGMMCWRRMKSAEMQVERGEVSHFTLFPRVRKRGDQSLTRHADNRPKPSSTNSSHNRHRRVRFLYLGGGGDICLGRLVRLRDV
jgi:hypothetical protein